MTSAGSTGSTDDKSLLRVISRHGTPTPHWSRDGIPCQCWSEAKQVLKDLHQAGYVIYREFSR